MMLLLLGDVAPQSLALREADRENAVAVLPRELLHTPIHDAAAAGLIRPFQWNGVNQTLERSARPMALFGDDFADFPILKGWNHSAQGCEERATLGGWSNEGNQL